MNVLRHHHRLVAVSTAAAALVTAIGFVLMGNGGHTQATERALQLPSWPRSASLVQDGKGPARASVTVRFRPGLSRAAQWRLLARVGAIETGSIPQLHLHILSTAPGQAQALLRSLRRTNAVEAATPDDVRQIAKLLHLSPKTVETHRAHIKEKLQLKNAREVARFAVQWVDARDI